MPPRRRPLPAAAALPLLLAGLAAPRRGGVALAQAPKGKRPPQPLGDVLHLVLDQDKDGSVTLDEVNGQLSMLETMFQSGEGDEAEEYKRLLAGVKSWAPGVFDLLDSDRNQGLSKEELSYATKFEKSLKKGGGMRDLVRDVFGAFDTDGDDRLSADELLQGSHCPDTLSKITTGFHGLFPLRSTPGELEDFVRSTIESLGGNTLDEASVKKYMEWIDDDRDGYVQRAEVGKYYNSAGKKFIEISKTIKQMGPMMAMFGGGGAGGAGGGGFKMDL